MDHVIDFILNYMSSDKDQLIDEWKSGKYEKMSDCPTYPYIKAYCDAVRSLNKLDGRYNGITPASILNS